MHVSLVLHLFHWQVVGKNFLSNDNKNSQWMSYALLFHYKEKEKNQIHPTEKTVYLIVSNKQRQSSIGVLFSTNPWKLTFRRHLVRLLTTTLVCIGTYMMFFTMFRHLKRRKYLTYTDCWYLWNGRQIFKNMRTLMSKFKLTRWISRLWAQTSKEGKRIKSLS